MGHRTLGMLQRYTHLDVQVTKKFSKIFPKRFFKESPHDKKNSLQRQKASKLTAIKGEDLVQDLRTMIEEVRQTVAIAINSSLTALNWKIGYRIRSEILQDKRADYGKEIVVTVNIRLRKRIFGEEHP